MELAVKNELRQALELKKAAVSALPRACSDLASSLVCVLNGSELREHETQGGTYIQNV
jgi:hypothetical protein